MSLCQQCRCCEQVVSDGDVILVPQIKAGASGFSNSGDFRKNFSPNTPTQVDSVSTKQMGWTLILPLTVKHCTLLLPL